MQDKSRSQNELSNTEAYLEPVCYFMCTITMLCTTEILPGWCQASVQNARSRSSPSCCSRTLLRSSTPPPNAEEIALSEHVNSCSVTRHLGSSLVPEQSQRQRVYSQSLSILLTPGKIPRALTHSASPDFTPWLCWSPISSSAQPCWRKSSQLWLPEDSPICQWENRPSYSSLLVKQLLKKQTPIYIISFSSGLFHLLPSHTSSWVCQSPGFLIHKADVSYITLYEL